MTDWLHKVKVMDSYLFWMDGKVAAQGFSELGAESPSDRKQSPENSCCELKDIKN